MKKTILFLIVIFAAVASVLPVFAAQHGTLALSASEAVKAGQTVTLSVKLTGAVDIDGIAVTPSYDEDKFELTGGTWKVNGVISDFSIANKDGVVAFSDGTKINTTILTFTLKVKKTTEAGSYKVGCSAVVSSTDGSKSTLNAFTQVNVTCTHAFTDKNTDAKYQKSEASCTSAAVYYYSCSKCGEKGTDTFKSGSALAHTFNQKNTAEKYVHTSGTCTSAAVYYFSCKCGEKGSDTFVGPAPSHRYSDTWMTDKDKHWYECLVCGDRKDYAVHTPGSEATEEHAQLCTVCQYELAPAIVHEHDFTLHWYGDESFHWGECRCKEQSEPVAHSWDDGKTVSESTSTQQGMILYTCKDCGRIKAEYTAPDPSKTDEPTVDPTPQPSKTPAEKTDEPDVDPTTKPSEAPVTDEPTDMKSGGKGSFGIGMLAGILIGLSIGGAVTFVSVSKLKKTK